jgi:hypothetical protein
MGCLLSIIAAIIGGGPAEDKAQVLCSTIYRLVGTNYSGKSLQSNQVQLLSRKPNQST